MDPCVSEQLLSVLWGAGCHGATLDVAEEDVIWFCACWLICALYFLISINI